MLSRVELRDRPHIERGSQQRERLMRALQAQHAEVSALQAAEPMPQQQPESGAPLRQPGLGGPPPGLPQQAPFVRGDRKVGRNEPCPCGSGKKFKQCHGTLSA